MDLERGDYVRENRWFNNWLTDHEIENGEQLNVALCDPALWPDLLDRAEGHNAEPFAPPLEGRSIVAGRSLDFTSFVSCAHPGCLVAQVEQLFRRAWHYFDTIAVVGADAGGILLNLERGDTERVREYLSGVGHAILHAKSIGAEDWLTYIEKPPASRQRWTSYAERTDLHLSPPVVEGLTARLMREANLSYKDEPHVGKVLHFRHPWIWNGLVFEDVAGLLRRRQPGETPAAVIAREMIEKYVLAAASDLAGAEELSLPLGVSIPLEAAILRLLRPVPSQEEIAFQLKLPAIAGLGIADLLRIRNSERDAFESFRLSLDEAMRQRLMAAGSASVNDVAAQIEREVIEPTLVDLRRRLTIAGKTLERKAAVHVGVVGLATVCGLLGIAPAATALALGAATSFTATGLKAVEERGSLEGSNMYFLWKLSCAASSAGPKKRRSRRRKS